MSVDPESGIDKAAAATWLRVGGIEENSFAVKLVFLITCFLSIGISSTTPTHQFLFE